MKKILLLSASILFLVTNAFALDLSTFTGTWKLSNENGTKEINISMQDSVLRITGLVDDKTFPEKIVFLSEGSTTFEGVPVTFSSGSFDDKALIINTIIHYSEVDSGSDLNAPDLTFSLALKILEESKQLRLQMGNIGYSSEDGLTAGVENYLYEKQE